MRIFELGIQTPHLGPRPWVAVIVFRDPPKRVALFYDMQFRDVFLGPHFLRPIRVGAPRHPAVHLIETKFSVSWGSFGAGPRDPDPAGGLGFSRVCRIITGVVLGKRRRNKTHAGGGEDQRAASNQLGTNW